MLSTATEKEFKTSFLLSDKVLEAYRKAGLAIAHVSNVGSPVQITYTFEFVSPRDASPVRAAKFLK